MLCDQSLVTLSFIWEKLSQPQFYKDLTKKTIFFEGRCWLKFNNLGLSPCMALAFYKSVTKGLQLKVRKFLELIPAFEELTGEKLVGGPFCPSPTPSWIGLNTIVVKRVETCRKNQLKFEQRSFKNYFW